MMGTRRFTDEALQELVARGLTIGAMAAELQVSKTAVFKRLSKLPGTRQHEAQAARAVVVVPSPPRRVGLPDIAGELNGSLGRLKGAVAYLDKDEGRESAPPEQRQLDPPKISPRDRIMLRGVIEGKITGSLNAMREVQELVLRSQDLDLFLTCLFETLDRFPGVRADFERTLEERRLSHMAPPPAIAAMSAATA
jgi:hypothetical protein